MKLIFAFILILSAILAIPSRTKELQPQEKEISKDTTLILEFVKRDSFIQKYILDPRFRVRVRQAEKELK